MENRVEFPVNAPMELFLASLKVDSNKPTRVTAEYPLANGSMSTIETYVYSREVDKIEWNHTVMLVSFAVIVWSILGVRSCLLLVDDLYYGVILSVRGLCYIHTRLTVDCSFQYNQIQQIFKQIYSSNLLLDRTMIFFIKVWTVNSSGWNLLNIIEDSSS